MHEVKQCRWLSVRWTGWKMMIVLRVRSFLIFSLFHSALGIPCTVTHYNGRTLYSVPHFIADGCQYFWNNMTNHVLANNEGKNNELVVLSNDTHLFLNGCSQQVRYERSCISEGTAHEATCFTNCSGNADLQRNGEEPLTTCAPLSPVITHTGYSRHHWIISIVIIGVVVVLLLLLCFKFRNRICRSP